MRMIYDSTDITDLVQIRSAIVRDASGKRSDSLDITLADAGKWYRWAPQTNDRIEITEEGYRSGIFHINSIIPQGDDYRILATASRTTSAEKNYDTYIGKSIDGILQLCAAECRMGYRSYGVDTGIVYPYWQRNYESCPGTLSRIARLEGAVMKTYNGKFTMIGIAAAQELPAMETIVITPEMQGTDYERRESEKWSSVTIVTGKGRVTVKDTNAKWGKAKTFADLAAADLATASRWARGLLLSQNRTAERLTVESRLHTAWSAMVRIDVTGGTDADGQWLIDEVTHDLVNKTSRAEMLRVYRIGEET